MGLLWHYYLEQASGFGNGVSLVDMKASGGMSVAGSVGSTVPGEPIARWCEVIIGFGFPLAMCGKNFDGTQVISGRDRPPSDFASRLEKWCCHRDGRARPGDWGLTLNAGSSSYVPQVRIIPVDVRSCCLRHEIGLQRCAGVYPFNQLRSVEVQTGSYSSWPGWAASGPRRLRGGIILPCVSRRRMNSVLRAGVSRDTAPRDGGS